MIVQKSKLVQEQRKRSYDRISTLIDAGGKWLIHAQAIREGVSIAEMLRRSIYARAGLRMLPYPEDLEKLAEVHTPEAAEAAILRLQAKEESNEIINRVLQKLSPEPDSSEFNLKVDADTREVLLTIAGLSIDEIAEIKKVRTEDEEVTVTGFEIGHLRRLLANMKENTRSSG